LFPHTCSVFPQCCQRVYVDWPSKTPMPKQPKYSNTSFVPRQYPSTFTLGTPAKCTSLPLLA
jgi:hypothetical protein